MSKADKDDLIQELISKVGVIAEVLAKGRDAEIRTSRDGITIIEVNKKVIK